MAEIIVLAKAWGLHQFAALLAIVWLLARHDKRDAIQNVKIENVENDVKKLNVSTKELADSGKDLLVKTSEIKAQTDQNTKDICLIKDKFEKHERKQGKNG